MYSLQKNMTLGLHSILPKVTEQNIAKKYVTIIDDHPCHIGTPQVA